MNPKIVLRSQACRRSNSSFGSIASHLSRSAARPPETLYGVERMETAGQWLEKALLDLCRKTDGLELDGDLISGLVSYCDLAPPVDAKEYLDVIAHIPYHYLFQFIFLTNLIHHYAIYYRLSSFGLVNQQGFAYRFAESIDAKGNLMVEFI